MRSQRHVPTFYRALTVNMYIKNIEKNKFSEFTSRCCNISANIYTNSCKINATTTIQA